MQTCDRLHELNVIDKNANDTIIQIDNTNNIFLNLSNQINSIDDDIKQFNRLIINYGNNLDKINDNKQISTISKKIEDRLKDTKQQIQNAIKSAEASDKNDADVKQLQFKNMYQKLADKIMDYNKLSDKFKNIKKSDNLRLLQIQYGDTVTDDQLEQLLVSDQLENNNLFQQSKHELAQIMENRNDILKIECSIKELYQMFADLSILLEEQHEIIIQINVNVNNANNNVENGRKNLDAAKKYNKSSRKKMCYVIIVMIVILVLILAIVLGFSL